MMRGLAMRGLAAVATLALLTLGPALAAHADDYDAEISAIDNAFDAGIVRIEPGRSIGWSNDGQQPAYRHGRRRIVRLGQPEPDDTYIHGFDQAGVYSYYCKYHGSPGVGMTGIVVVGDVAIPGATGGGVGPGREPVPAASPRPCGSRPTSRRSRRPSITRNREGWSWSRRASTTRRSSSRRRT